MTLVNIDPHIILHKKMHVPSTGIFVGRSIGLPAPCAPLSHLTFLIPQLVPSSLENSLSGSLNKKLCYCRPMTNQNPDSI